VLAYILGSNFGFLSLGNTREVYCKDFFLEFSQHLGKRMKFRKVVANALQAKILGCCEMKLIHLQNANVLLG